MPFDWSPFFNTMQLVAAMALGLLTGYALWRKNKLDALALANEQCETYRREIGDSKRKLENVESDLREKNNELANRPNLQTLEILVSKLAESLTDSLDKISRHTEEHHTLLMGTMKALLDQSHAQSMAMMEFATALNIDSPAIRQAAERTKKRLESRT